MAVLFDTATMVGWKREEKEEILKRLNFFNLVSLRFSWHACLGSFQVRTKPNIFFKTDQIKYVEIQFIAKNIVSL